MTRDAYIKGLDAGMRGEAYDENIDALREQQRRPYDVDLTVRVHASSASEAEAIAHDPAEWEQTSVIEAREA